MEIFDDIPEELVSKVRGILPTCCFTGHRIVQDAETVRAKLSEVIDELIEKGYVNFICGGALGFDTLAAEVVLEKRQNNKIFLEIAVPCRDQDAKWTESQKAKYKEILDKADEVTVLSNKYVRGCMHKRNEYMVNNAQTVVAYYRNKPGGTEYTCKYAEKAGKEIIHV